MNLDHQRLEALRFEADPDADAVVAALLGSGAHANRDLGAVNALLRAYVRNDQAPAADLPPILRDFLETNRHLPADVDRERLGRASSFFVDHGMTIGVILGLPSLLECYTASRGVKALHATDRMGYSGAEKRVGDTAQFVVHVMAPGGLTEPARKGIPTLLKVRLMHAASRKLIAETGWDREALGVPICQEDLVATLLTFGYTPLAKLPKLGVKVSATEQEDFLYFWRIASRPLGVRQDLLPASFEEAEALFTAICAHQQGKTPEGVDLARTLLEVYARLVPGKALDGMVPGLARFLTGDAVCDMLEVPRSPWVGAIRGGAFFFELFQGAQARSRIVNDLVNKLGWAQLNHLAVRFSGGRQAEFDIPAELRRAWRLPPSGGARAARTRLAELVSSIASRHGAAAREPLLEVAVLVADADGAIDDLEAATLAETVRALGMEGEDEASISKRAARLRKAGSTPSLARLAEELRTLGLDEDGLTAAVLMAYANSGIATEERAVLDALAMALGLDIAALDARVDTIVRGLAA